MSRWENIGDKYLLNALGADPLAASQSVAMYLDPVGKCIEWHTNGHVIRLRPDLPSAIISGPFPTSFGYEWNLAGGLVFGIGDVSLTKRAGVLDTWGIEGIQLYYIVPVGQIPQTPTVRIEKIDILDGMIDSLNLSLQGVLTAQEIADGGSRIAPWVDNSLVLSWADKRNNNGSDNHGKYMNGKILQKAPPLAHPLVCADLQAGNTANRSFGAANGSETLGWYETLPAGFQKAYNLQDLIDRRGTGTHYAFAATLGYNTLGTSIDAARISSPRGFLSNSLFTMPEDGTVTAFNYADGIDSAPNGLAIYDSADNLAGDAIGSGTVAAGWWSLAMAASLLSGTAYHLGVGWATGGNGNAVVRYDTASGKNYEVFTSGVTPWQDPLTATPVLTRADREMSIYVDYTAGGGGGIIPQIMHHRQQQRRR